MITPETHMPSGWAFCSVADISELIRGITYKKEQSSKSPAPDLMPILRANNINGGLNFDGLVYVPRSIVEKVQSIKQGDIIFAMSSGSLHLVGKSAQAQTNWDGSCGAFCAILRIDQPIFSKFLAFLFQGNAFRRKISETAKGSNINNLKREHILEHQLALPPLAEQRRIVAKIEELFSDLDKGIENLKLAQAQLKVFRQALLKHAIEGKLTDRWRAANNKKLKSGKQLYADIQSKRRKIWEEAQLLKFKESGKEPPKDWKEKYIEPVAHENVKLSPLPEGWAIASMDSLTSRITSGSRDWQQYYGSGSGVFIMAQNVRPGSFDMRFRQSVNPPTTDSSCERSLVACDDLLVTIVGANTGDVCRVPEDLKEHYVCQSVALMRPVESATGRFLDKYFNSLGGGQLHFRRYLYGAGRPHLSFDQLRMTPVLLPPLAEQTVIVEIVEEQFSVIDQLESDIATNLQKAEALRQSILKKAFAGHLVPQDPADEPASELLARIRVERETKLAEAKAETKSKSKPKKVSTAKV